MPRDAIYEYALSKPNLDKPTLPGLAWLLRHQESKEWENHTWSFKYALLPRTTYEHYGFMGLMRRTRCGTSGCAMGLALLRWEPAVAQSRMVDSRDAGKICRAMFDLDKESALAIFWAGSTDPCITPGVVANRIDDYLAGRKIRYRVAGDRVGADA